MSPRERRGAPALSGASHGGGAGGGGPRSRARPDRSTRAPGAALRRSSGSSSFGICGSTTPVTRWIEQAARAVAGPDHRAVAAALERVRVGGERQPALALVLAVALEAVLLDRTGRIWAWKSIRGPAPFVARVAGRAVWLAAATATAPSAPTARIPAVSRPIFTPVSDGCPRTKECVPWEPNGSISVPPTSAASGRPVLRCSFGREEPVSESCHPWAEGQSTPFGVRLFALSALLLVLGLSATTLQAEILFALQLRVDRCRPRRPPGRRGILRPWAPLFSHV